MSVYSPDALFSLKGRTALVTGAGGHLGTAIVRALAGAGATLYLSGRRVEPLQSLAGELAAQGISSHVLPLDVTDGAAIGVAVSHIASENGRLDVLVNNAHSGRTGTLESALPEDYAKSLCGLGASNCRDGAAEPATNALGRG